jgi:hypothetical protein
MERLKKKHRSRSVLSSINPSFPFEACPPTLTSLSRSKKDSIGDLAGSGALFKIHTKIIKKIFFFKKKVSVGYWT